MPACGTAQDAQRRSADLPAACRRHELHHRRVAAQEGDDEGLVAAACEAMPVLAQALGPAAYAPVFAGQHAEPLLRFLRPSQPADVRSVAVGARAAGKDLRQGPAGGEVLGGRKRLTTLMLTGCECMPTSAT